jgi:hypothetical protein
VVTAYILIQTEVGKAAQVAKDIVEIKGVQQAEDVTGPYDVIAATSTSWASWWSRACKWSTASPGPSPARWCASSAARRALSDHLLVYGRQQQRQRHHWIAAVGSDRLRQGVPARRRVRTALNCGNRV